MNTKTRLSAIGEFPLIQHLTKRLPHDQQVVCGVGDDCAVLERNRKWYDLLKTDMVIEGVHFTQKSSTPEEIGYKALGRVISDIAAMGGIPRYAVIAIALPRTLRVAYVERIYRGIRRCADHHAVSLVGGDTACADRIMITISMMGIVEKNCVVYRQGACPGDRVCVTGTLGGSLRSKHTSFIPRVNEARFLAQKHYVTSLIDISDGFLQDLGHLLDARSVGAEITLTKIPISRDAWKQASGVYTDALYAALSDGEDFELLCTIPQNKITTVMRTWKRHFRTPLTCVGVIQKKKGIRTEEGMCLCEEGYTHFRNKKACS